MLQKFDPKMRVDDHAGGSHRLGGMCATTTRWCATQTDLSDPSAKLTEVHQHENVTPIRKEVQSSFTECPVISLLLLPSQAYDSRRVWHPWGSKGE
jgi:hypothetical protein